VAGAEAGGGDDGPISEADLAAAEREGLHDEAHLDLFVTWLALGGPQRGLSPLEVAAMPAGMVQDWLYLTRKLGEARRAAKAAQEAGA